MTNTQRRFGKTLQPSHEETKDDIAAHTEDFLRHGGVIQCIPNGVSGQIWKPTRHIKLSKSQS